MMIAIFLAATSFVTLMLSLYTIAKRERLMTILLGLCTCAFAGVSMYLLHIMLLQSGKGNSVLGAVFGTWGQERLVVPMAYSITIIAGFAIVVFALEPKRFFTK